VHWNIRQTRAPVRSSSAVHQWRSEEERPDMSSGPWGTFATSVGRTATWYVVLYCTVTFGTLCIIILSFKASRYSWRKLAAHWLRTTAIRYVRWVCRSPGNTEKGKRVLCMKHVLVRNGASCLTAINPLGSN
jgi:hypothetical protein